MSIGLARYIWSYIQASLPMLRIGGGFEGGDDVLWNVSMQKNDGKTTGNIIVVCDDDVALAELVRLAKEHGHVVSKTDEINTIIITPKLN